MNDKPLTRDSWGWSEDERLCFDRGMDQWRKSLARPDMSEEDRVKGALEAYIRQAFAIQLMLVAEADGRVKPQPDESRLNLNQRT